MPEGNIILTWIVIHFRSIIFSVIRLISLNSMNFDDFAYTVIHVMIWTTAEVGVIIMVASSALLQPVFDKMFSGILSLSGSKNNSRPSQRHINSKSKMGSRSRKDFVAVGDGTEVSTSSLPFFLYPLGPEPCPYSS